MLAVATGAAAGIWVLDIDPETAGARDAWATRCGLRRTCADVVCGDRRGWTSFWFRTPGSALRSSAGRARAGTRCSRRWRLRHRPSLAPPLRQPLSLGRMAGTPPASTSAPAPTWLIELARQASTPKMIPPVRPPIGGGVGGNHLQRAPGRHCRRSTQRNLDQSCRLDASQRLWGSGHPCGTAGRKRRSAVTPRSPSPRSPDCPIHQPLCPGGSRSRPSRRPSRAKTFVEFIDGKAVAR